MEQRSSERYVETEYVFGLPPGYRVYESGRVTSMKSGKERELSTYVAKTGYRSVGLKRGKHTAVHLIHRLVALCFIPNLRNRPQINHIDGNKLNNAVSNLEWCTDSENKLHAYRIGLNPRSTPARRAANVLKADKMIAARRRFSALQAKSIQLRRENGESCRAIARDYGCSHSLISRICSGKSYGRPL